MLFVVGAALLLTGAWIGYLVRSYLGKRALRSAKEEAEKILDDARREAEARKREAELEAKDLVLQARAEFEREVASRRQELIELETRLVQREENLDRKVELIDKKEQELREFEENLHKFEGELKKREGELKKLIEEEKRNLERVSGLSAEEARKILMERIEEEAKHDAALLVKRIEDEAERLAERRAKEIISLAIQRCAAEHVAEATVSVVSLPNDEMKGRIIGREGRNIRAFETITGINVIIDDTPEAVILSGFDSVRREIARIALERLIADGRIHPARIEEVVEKVRQEVETNIREEGERVAFELGVHNLHPEEIMLLGRLKYRTSYGQNVLQHSIEVAQLAAIMAAELGENEALAKRIGLLHDIGKAVDHQLEGSHAVIGAELARKYGEPPEVVEAIEAHHGDVEPKSIAAVLLQAADALSAARPGARRETLETYIRRLEKLEAIADSFKGVEKAYAIQAGREIRVMVRPEQISDEEAVLLARQIAKKIESELEYPGQIKVTLIREVRAVDYAK